MKPSRAQTGYLSFSRKDRIAAAGFVLLFGFLYCLPRLVAPPRQMTVVADSLLYNMPPDSRAGTPAGANDPAPAYGPGAAGYGTGPAAHRSYPPPFLFDPNRLDAAGWQRLGLSDRAARSILKYREKGGRFRKPEDLQKFRALPLGFYERVATHIQIEPEERPDYVSAGPPATAPPAPDRPKRPVATVRINEADSADWAALPGIGATLTGRILRYRNRLGGFVSIDQVGEVWGLPDSTFRKIRPYLIFTGTTGVQKFNLNSATREELRAHPYIRWSLAKLIIEYRERHGPYQSVDDLKNLDLMSDSTLKRVRPYLSIF
ncbi:ComEA family DNA-binding protein [Flaviaesturariibacter amylovorans]|uniref:Helix-hairpin-helix domain-containing protein n=1 Tax=Flaviaesturariibacter amylovorans TaxID=1084520 RepID=A0ABP8GM04_9BACT